MKTLVLLFLVLGITVAIVVVGSGHGKKGRFSSSSSSEEHRGRGRPRPGPPRRPPREPKGSCEPGWLRFVRPHGVWCILVGNSGIVTGWQGQQDAEIVCGRYNATLTGFQNADERIKVADEALKQLPALNQQIAGLWLGATNNPGCQITSCGPLATFRWTDGHTTGTAGFAWARDEPDNYHWAGPTVCAQQIIMAPNYMTGPRDYGWWMTYFSHGVFDKYRCAAPIYPVTRMYACGKPGI